MLKFFPAPYPDELLYSVLARYHLRSGNLGVKATLRELFGSLSVVATIDLPSHLDELIASLPPLASFTADNLIYDQTLYPYYAPFLKPIIAAQIKDSMKGHHWGDIHTRSGIVASNINRPNHLRFCPACFRADEKTFGEPYWHRVHQLPGVLICPTHQVFLHDSNVHVFGGNRHEFIAADAKHYRAELQSISISSSTFAKLLLLAQDSDALLKRHFLTKDPSWFRQQYSGCLIDRGLAIASGRIEQKSFHQQFQQFYGKEMLNLVESPIEKGNDTDWLANIVRKQRKAFHPLRHLLLIRFLDLTPESFWRLELHNKPFGDGHWACFNGAANHYRERVINKHSSSWSTDTKKPLGYFECDCGFCYTTSDPDVAAGLCLKPLRVKSFGSIWENKLKELAARKPRLRELARHLKVDPKTVLHQCQRLGVSYRQHQIIGQKQAVTGSDDSTHAFIPAKENRRRQWQELCARFPQSTVTELRRKAPATWTWLYRHDKDWLRQHAPMAVRRKPQIQRVNWQKRDQQIAADVQSAVLQILATEPLQRVTKSRIGKNIGKLALLEHLLNKLPQTKSLLEKHCESPEQYRIRRIRRAIRQLLRKSHFVRVWEVVRLAGLRKEYAIHLESFIQKEIRIAATSLRKQLG